MARKPKAQLHPDVAAALPVAIAAIDDTPAPVRRGRKAKVDTDSPAPAETPRRKGPQRSPKSPATAAAAPLPEDSAPERRGPKRRTPQPDARPERVGNEAPGHEEESQTGRDAGNDPVPMDTGPAASDDSALPLPGLDAPSPARPAAHWDQATDTVRFDWPAIEQTAAASGPNQGMAKLLLAARAEGASSRWPL